jgi:hypothetical protein
MARPYSAVAAALQDLGGSIQGGFKDMGDAKLTAAQLALQQTQQAHDIKKEEFLFPEMKVRRDNANRELSAQAELDSPLTTQNWMNKTFNDDVKDYELGHFFANDVPGTFMKSAGITYNQEQDRYFHPDGRVVSNRDFHQAAPLFQNVILAKTDYVKRAQDELALAKANGDNTKIVELNKLLNDPNKKFHLGVYDAQEKALIDAKAKWSQLPKGTVDTSFIDDSITRINRKRDELIRDLEFNRKLSIKQKTNAGALTQKQKVDIWDNAHKWGEQEIARMTEEGLLTKKGVKSILGIEYGEKDVPFTPQEIQGLRREITNNRYLSDILVAIGEDPRKLNFGMGTNTSGRVTPKQTPATAKPGDKYSDAAKKAGFVADPNSPEAKQKRLDVRAANKARQAATRAKARDPERKRDIKAKREAARETKANLRKIRTMERWLSSPSAKIRKKGEALKKELDDKGVVY